MMIYIGTPRGEYGEWFEDVELCEPEAIWKKLPTDNHEEFVIQDTDGFHPVPAHRYSIAKAVRLAHEVDEANDPAAFLAFVAGDFATDIDPEDYAQQFRDRYRGHYGDLAEFGLELYHETHPDPPKIARYVNWNHYGRDLRHNYTVIETDEPGGGIYVFHLA